MDIEISELFSKFWKYTFSHLVGKGMFTHSLLILYAYREFILFLYFLTDQSLGFAKNKVLWNMMPQKYAYTRVVKGENLQPNYLV